MNPIRLVSGAFALPAHAAAAVIGTSVGVAATGARTTARVVGRVIERASGSDRVAPEPWPGERAPSTEIDPILGTRRAPRKAPADAPAEATSPAARTAPAPEPTPEPAAEAGAKKSPAAKTSAKKVPAKKAAAKKAPAKKAPARKAAAKKAPSKQAAVLAPALGLSEAEVVAEIGAGPDDEVTTPSGIPAAGHGVNPDTTETDLHQPGTEPLMDPATAKAVASESAVLRRAADTDKG